MAISEFGVYFVGDQDSSNGSRPICEMLNTKKLLWNDVGTALFMHEPFQQCLANTAYVKIAGPGCILVSSLPVLHTFVFHLEL